MAWITSAYRDATSTSKNHQDSAARTYSWRRLVAGGVAGARDIRGGARGATACAGICVWPYGVKISKAGSGVWRCLSGARRVLARRHGRRRFDKHSLCGLPNWLLTACRGISFRGEPNLLSACTARGTDLLLATRSAFSKYHFLL